VVLACCISRAHRGDSHTSSKPRAVPGPQQRCRPPQPSTCHPLGLCMVRKGLTLPPPGEAATASGITPILQMGKLRQGSDEHRLEPHGTSGRHLGSPRCPEASHVYGPSKNAPLTETTARGRGVPRDNPAGVPLQKTRGGHVCHGVEDRKGVGERTGRSTGDRKPGEGSAQCWQGGARRPQSSHLPAAICGSLNSKRDSDSQVGDNEAPPRGPADVNGAGARPEHQPHRSESQPNCVSPPVATGPSWSRGSSSSAAKSRQHPGSAPPPQRPGAPPQRVTARKATSPATPWALQQVLSLQ